MNLLSHILYLNFLSQIYIMSLLLLLLLNNEVI